MTLLLPLYWFLCYSVLLVALVLSGLRSLCKVPGESAHFLLVFSFGLLMVGSTVYAVMGSNTGALAGVLDMLAISGICLGIYAVPALSLAFEEINRGKRILLVCSGIAGGLFWLANIIFRHTKAIVLVMYGTYLVFFGIVLFVSATGLYRSLKSKKQAIDFWNKVTRAFSVISLVFVPGFVVFDLYGGFRIAFIHNIIQSGFRFFPMFFVSWSAVYIFELVRFSRITGNILGIINIESIRDSLSEEKMEAFGLSPRERETARHLVAGMSYKEIAGALDISVATIKTHISRIYEKTGARSKIELLNKISTLS